VRDPDGNNSESDHTRRIHAHVITDDDRTGHLDALSLSNAARLEVGVRSLSMTRRTGQR
jgi:hypothetical protein